MKKFINALAIVLCLSMVTLVVSPNIGVETVEAAEYDWLFDEDDYDYFDDEEYDDDEYEYNFDNVKNTFESESISQSGGIEYSKTTLSDKKTNVYPINVKKTAKYIFGMTDESDGEGAILVVDSKGKTIYEEELDLMYKSWNKTLSLSKGKYYIKILSKDWYKFQYKLYVKPLVLIKKETTEHKLTSYDKKSLNPKLGKGRWKTSNENIIGIISKNSNKSSTCKIQARKAGKATVTYTNDNGSVIKYKFTVSAIKNVSKDLKISSCDLKDLKSKIGKGKWTTSNKNIIEILSKNKDYSSTCKIRAKNPGKATITYTDQYGYVAKYIFTVFTKSTYPLDDAYFKMDSVGGLEPSILISNNSNKKIKYIYLDVSFYNAVGDRVYNDIGGYKNAKLEITGYINPWNFEWYYWNPVFYSTTARMMKIETIQIVYSDGSKKNTTLQLFY